MIAMRPQPLEKKKRQCVACDRPGNDRGMRFDFPAMGCDDRDRRCAINCQPAKVDPFPFLLLQLTEALIPVVLQPNPLSSASSHDPAHLDNPQPSGLSLLLLRRARLLLLLQDRFLKFTDETAKPVVKKHAPQNFQGRVSSATL